MDLPIVPLFFGFALVNIGFWSMYVALWRRGGLGSSRDSMAKGLQAFRQPQTPFERFALRAGPALFGVGAIVCFATVAISDAQKNRPCKAACKTAGQDGGWVRANPHDASDKARRCWCYTGSASSPTWTVEP